MPQSLFNVTGFDDLNRKLKQLPDKVKRTEVVKIQRRLAKPLLKAYKNNVPVGKRNGARKTSGQNQEYKPGNLKRSIKIKTVPGRKVGGNPYVAILPTTGGRNNGYYRFMVVPIGFRGSGRGSRKRRNTVVRDARNRAFKRVSTSAASKYERQTALYIQKTINRL